MLRVDDGALNFVRQTRIRDSLTFSALSVSCSAIAGHDGAQ
jgi:hypothetical protein